MTIDPSLLYIVATVFTLAVLGLLFDYIRQPVIIAYLLAGVVLGPHALGIFPEPSVLNPLAGIALVMLLFFIGMEVDLGRLTAQWRIALLGSMSQTLISVGIVWVLGVWLHWPLARIVLFGFVITLSSTPIVLRILSDKGMLNTRLGANTLGILVVQDLLAIPMLVLLGMFQGDSPSIPILTLQVSSTLLLVAIIALAMRHQGFRLPLASRVYKSPELQVLVALVVCFGTAFITGLMQLSVVLGGFIAGLLVRISDSLSWIRTSLEPFYFVLAAMFFVSVGLLIDVRFFVEEIWLIVGLTLLAMVINTLVNALTLIALREDWRESVVTGASLAQLGEFGFVLAALGLSSGIIGQVGYQYVLAVTAMSWLVSPAWITLIQKLVYLRSEAPPRP